MFQETLTCVLDAARPYDSSLLLEFSATERLGYPNQMR
jgi:hypothetical protein